MSTFGGNDRITPVQSNRFAIFAIFLTFGIASLMPVVRFSLSKRSDSFGKTLWAEDGMFIFSADQHGFLTTFAPYRGYLHVVPRFLASLISLFPISSWALVEAIFYCLFNGFIAAILYVAARAFTRTAIAASLLALVPTLSPLFGLEAIGSIANLNVVLAYVAVVLGLTLRQIINSNSFQFTTLIVFLAMIVLTTPTAGPYLLLVAVFLGYKQVKCKRYWLLISLFFLTSVVQFTTSLFFQDGRTFNLQVTQISHSFSLAFDAVLSLVPGMTFRTATAWGHSYSAVSWVRPSLMLLLLVVGVLGVVKVRSCISSLMLVSGFFLWFAAISRGDAYAGSSRYYLYLMFPLTGSLIVFVDKRISQKALIFSTVLVGFLWIPSLAVSEFRTSGARWTDYINLADQICKSNPTQNVDVQFAPNWPIDWSFDLTGVNSNEWDCVD
jgi:hypothetical protein